MRTRRCSGEVAIVGIQMKGNSQKLSSRYWSMKGEHDRPGRRAARDESARERTSWDRLRQTLLLLKGSILGGKSVLCGFLMVLSLTFLLAQHVPVIGAEPGSRPSEAPSPAADSGQIPNSSKLLESVSGYFEGMHGTKPDVAREVPSKPRQQRRQLSEIRKQDTQPERGLDQEVTLAEKRIHREEWGLAVNTLERAVQMAAVAGPADEAERLKELLQGAKQQADRGPERPPSAGEVTNSIGMRMAVIRPGTFVMGSTEAEIRRIQNEWNVQESLLQPEGPSHNVKISRPFLLGKYEVTVGQFKRLWRRRDIEPLRKSKGWAGSTTIPRSIGRKKAAPPGEIRAPRFMTIILSP